jgi:hypothetical protein
MLCMQSARNSSFDDRLIEQKIDLEKELSVSKNSMARNEIRRKLRQIDTAAHIHDWLIAADLKPPH